MKVMTEIQSARYAALCRKFPFLGRYIKNVAWLTAVPMVKQIDLRLLEAKPYTYTWYQAQAKCRWALLHDEESMYVFIRADGAEIAWARAADAKAPPARWRSQVPVVTDGGETLLEAIRRLPQADDVAYVVRVHDDYNRAVKTPYQPFTDPNTTGLTVTLYKVPTGQTLSNLVARLSEAADKELERHLAELDKA